MLDSEATNAIDDIGNNLKGIFSREETYQQLFVICLALALAWLFAMLVQMVMRRKVKAALEENSLLGHGIRVLYRVLFPLFSVLLIAFSQTVCRLAKLPVDLMPSASTIVVAWLFISLVLQITKHHFVAQVIAWTLLVSTVLSVTQTLEPTVRLLDSFAMEIGGLRISLWALLRGAIIFSVLLWIARMVSTASEHRLSHASQLEMNSQILAAKLIKTGLYAVAFLITLNIMGVNLTALTVFGGALAVGIGFGLQKIMSNFISGIILLIERTVKIGDLIQVGGETGWVRQMGIRYTLVENLDGREIMIPNEELILTKLINWTYTNPKARVDVVMTFEHGSDVEKVRNLILEVTRSYKRALQEPAPICQLSDVLPVGFQFTLMFWIADISDGVRSAKSDILFRLIDAFGKNGIRFSKGAEG